MLETTNLIQAQIRTLAEGKPLSREETARCFQIIMTGGATPAQIAAVLMAMRLHGETVEEITGAAEALRAKSEKIASPPGTLDTCGTGGDGLNTLNISTAVAFVAAACGVPVAKHGNKAVSSRSGSADVLTELGVNVQAKRDVCEHALAEIGICFMMAPVYHPAMRHVAPIRQELGIRSIFNLIGPLTNPAGAKFQLLGVFSEHLLEPFAEALRLLGSERAWIVHGKDGLDELSISGPSHVAELKDGKIHRFTLDPASLGLTLAPIDTIRGGSARANADALLALFNGPPSPYRDIVCLNAAAALVVAGKASSLEAALPLAAQAIDSGEALEKLQRLIRFTSLPA